ncbi:hypothetical protein MRX96_030595 [Rhipicephalus microplus]
MFPFGLPRHAIQAGQLEPALFDKHRKRNEVQQLHKLPTDSPRPAKHDSGWPRFVALTCSFRMVSPTGVTTRKDVSQDDFRLRPRCVLTDGATSHQI